ncbi:MAG: flagellar hook-basal body complex protein FliE [Nitrospiria bacterium]
MNIKPLGQHVNPELTSKDLNPLDKNEKPFIDSLKESLSKVNALQETAAESVNGLASGGEQSLHQTMIAVEKADVSFQLMMQVRNKILSAYEEISRMQI